jgi:hypothetical protein
MNCLLYCFIATAAYGTALQLTDEDHDYYTVGNPSANSALTSTECRRYVYATMAEINAIAEGFDPFLYFNRKI